jgi:DNA-binding MarR family transcriptional regulator
MIGKDDTFVLLHSMMKKMWKIADRELAPLEICHTEMQILMALYFFYADGCGQEELVSQLDVDRSNVGRALKKLERLHYIERRKDEKDRRAYRVFLTEHGRAIREQIVTIREAMKRTFTLEMTDQEIEMLTSLLKKADHSLNAENFRALKNQG